MALASGPTIFIACLLGMGLLSGLVIIAFYFARRRGLLGKILDPEATADLDYAGFDSQPHRRLHEMEQQRQQLQQQQQQQPPAYCAEDPECPPPSYQAVFTRRTSPTQQEMRILRRRLEKLQRRRTTTAAAAGPGCEATIYDSEIRSLARWIERLTMLRQGADEEDEDDGINNTFGGAAMNQYGIRPVRLAHSQSEPAVLLASPTAAAAAAVFHRHEAGWRGGGGLLQLRALSSPLLSEEVDVRFAEVREQVIRGMREDRYSLPAGR